MLNKYIDKYKEVTIEHDRFAPYDPSVLLYMNWDSNVQMPLEYTGWIDETNSWKENCYFSPFLSGPMADLYVKGPDAERLMSDSFVNSFTLDKFPVGGAKHVIACSPKGTITRHGMALRTAEDEFHTYSLAPLIPMKVNSGKYDVEQYEPVFFKDFVFQFAGPRSLEVVENVIEQDIHDLNFMRFIYAKVAGRDVRVLRMGMGRTLSYEIHGERESAMDVYAKVMEVGERYGLRRLGVLSYDVCNHTENGFPQVWTHFMPATVDDPELVQFMGYTEETKSALENVELCGSAADMGPAFYYTNPIELGWGKMINWDHDFTGKEALRKIADDPTTRQMCTLEWNPDDILEIFRAYYDHEDNRVPDQMCFPRNPRVGGQGNLSDKILNEDGKVIGRSSGTIYTRYYKQTISLGIIDPKYCKEGKQVTVLWGTPGTRQIPIRATVARFPYLNLPANKDYDVGSIPRYGK